MYVHLFTKRFELLTLCVKLLEIRNDTVDVGKGAASKRKGNQSSNFLQACGEDHAGVAKLLLRKKAFIDETDNDGWSALHYAAANDSALAAEVLVQYDVNLKAKTESTNETALEMAERLRSHLVAILLYEVTYRKP